MWGLWSNVCKGLYCVWKKVLCTVAVTVLAMAFIIIVSHLQPSVTIACCFYCQVRIPVWPATWVTTAAQGRLSGQPGGEIPNSWCLSVPFAPLRRNDFQLYCWADPLWAALKHWLGSHCPPSCSACLLGVQSGFFMHFKYLYRTWFLNWVIFLF